MLSDMELDEGCDDDEEEDDEKVLTSPPRTPSANFACIDSVTKKQNKQPPQSNVIVQAAVVPLGQFVNSNMFLQPHSRQLAIAVNNCSSDLDDIVEPVAGVSCLPPGIAMPSRMQSLDQILQSKQPKSRPSAASSSASSSQSAASSSSSSSQPHWVAPNNPIVLPQHPT